MITVRFSFGRFEGLLASIKGGNPENRRHPTDIRVLFRRNPAILFSLYVRNSDSGPYYTTNCGARYNINKAKKLARPRPPPYPSNRYKGNTVTRQLIDIVKSAAWRLLTHMQCQK